MLAELGRAEARTGAPAAVEHLEQAVALAPTRAQAAEAALELPALLKFAGHAVRAVEVLEAASARLGPGDRDLDERLQVELIGSAMISMGARPLLAPTLDRAARSPAARRPPSSTGRSSSGLAFNGFAEGGPADEVAELATRALAGGELPTDPWRAGTRSSAR